MLFRERATIPLASVELGLSRLGSVGFFGQDEGSG
jgi:hypothetical protein